MNAFKTLISAASLLAFASFANSAVITTLQDATNGGGFFGEVTFSDKELNTVTVAATVDDSVNAGLTEGDILALWFDFADFSALSGTASVSNKDPASMPAVIEFSEDSVGTSPDSFPNNLNINESNWDFAIQTGVGGESGGVIQSLSFDLTIVGLNANQFLNQRVGMRVQSIEGDNSFGFGEDSSKLIGSGGSVPVPEPGTIALLALGLLGLGISRCKSHR